MLSFLHKWLTMAFMGTLFTVSTPKQHPIFVSVTEIEHNAKEKTLEVSCKIFTDDFEKTLRNAYKTKIDLADANLKPAMDKLINDYVQKHLKINVDGKQVALKYLGFEKIDEGIYSYYQADNVTSVKNAVVTDDILYEYKSEQISLIHFIVNGDRKSTKLNNPENRAVLSF